MSAQLANQAPVEQKHLRDLASKRQYNSSTVGKKCRDEKEIEGVWRFALVCLPSLASIWWPELEDLSLLEGRELSPCSCILARSQGRRGRSLVQIST
jgi:hypothetical protein